MQMFLQQEMKLKFDIMQCTTAHPNPWIPLSVILFVTKWFASFIYAYMHRLYIKAPSTCKSQGQKGQKRKISNYCMFVE